MINKNKLIFKYAKGKKSILPKNSLIDILIKSFKKNSKRAAIVYDDIKISYQALDIKSNAVADMLLAQSVKKGDVVLVEMENSIEILFSLIGILKIGAIYIPISPTWPLIRKTEVERITQAKIILVKSTTKYREGKNLREIVIDYKKLSNDEKIFKTSVSDQDAVYGFFTSGSTGTPKCAINTQIGLLNRLIYMNRRFGCSKSDVVLQNSKNIFDSSMWQLLWPLMNGALLVIPNNNENFVPVELVNLISKYQITVTDFVPSIFNYFIKFLQTNDHRIELKSLRQILIGGEEMDVQDVTYFRNKFPHVGITNTYGPTECSIGTIFYEVPLKVPASIPIGNPIDNVSAIILKKNMQPVSLGEVGEIYLGGVCVGLGYKKNKRKTKQVFIKNNFTELSGSMLYKTGDFGIYLPDGNIKYMGRFDQQIKINGVRVELGEIENKIKEIEGVDRVVVYYENELNQKKKLHAVVSIKNKKINSKIIQDWCQKNIPFNLIPDQIKILDIMPLTTTGKINRRLIKDLLFR